MISYNGDLRSAVIVLMANQQLELKNITSQWNAAIFTLFYAEEARITACQKLDDGLEILKSMEKIKDAAGINNSIAVNTNASAKDLRERASLSVNNVSVAAANVQIAANAIMKLASDIGSIFSVVSAADFNTDIYEQTKEANRLMSITASEAELSSQRAMEASSLTAQISSSILADMASVTQKSIANLVSTSISDFNTVTALIATDNANLSNASNAEKETEGILQCINADYLAALSSYVLTNKELNLDLHVASGKKNNTSFDVQFDFYKNPFTDNQDTIQTLPNTSEGLPVKVTDGAVKAYYIMLVKDRQKSIFSIENAEFLLSKRDRFIRIKGVPKQPDQKFIKKTIGIADLKDSDGDSIQLAVGYVVFVLAVFTDEYKKEINNFDDYLSAPSLPFTLTNNLASPKPADIRIAKLHPDILEFSVIEDHEYSVEYRCLLLPADHNLLKGLLTTGKLKNLENEVETIANGGGKKVAETLETGFFFNLKIAEQIPDGNYTTAKKNPNPPEIKVSAKKGATKHWQVKFSENTNDLFGNKIEQTAKYIPAILSISTAPEESRHQFANSLSDFEKTKPVSNIIL